MPMLMGSIGFPPIPASNPGPDHPQARDQNANRKSGSERPTPTDHPGSG